MSLAPGKSFCPNMQPKCIARHHKVSQGMHRKNTYGTSRDKAYITLENTGMVLYDKLSYEATRMVHSKYED